MENIHLIALDIGSTTTSAFIARAKLTENYLTQESHISNIIPLLKIEPILTPFIGDKIDIEKISIFFDKWLSYVPQTTTVIGGALITGLAATKANAPQLSYALRTRLKGSLIARADDPHLESYVAFMGNCAQLSQIHPDCMFMNLDIGGGTTNVAVGIHNTIIATGSYWIGARHFRFKPGTYDIVGLSKVGKRILDHVKIRKKIGQRLEKNELKAILDLYIHALEQLVLADDHDAYPLKLFEQKPLPKFSCTQERAITYSGGVGELIYRENKDEHLKTTLYGDLGIEVANCIITSPLLSKDLTRFVPHYRGRATVYGLAVHSTKIAGNTIFKSSGDFFPLRDVPIVGILGNESTEREAKALIAKAYRKPEAAAIEIELTKKTLENIKAIAQKIATAIDKINAKKEIPLIFFISENCGKTLGNYITDFQKKPYQIVVIDEIKTRGAQFAHIVSSFDDRVLVSFYGGVHEFAYVQKPHPSSQNET